jgi:hypothetical protein
MSNCYNSELPIGPPGPTGPQGLKGQQGLDGTVWLNGPGDPSPSVGVNNDYWLDTDTGNLWIKAYQGLDLLWFYVTTINGTDGINGEDGLDGINGTSLVDIEYDSINYKSLGRSAWITTTSLPQDTSFYSRVFLFEGNKLCPSNGSIAKINLFYETNANNGGATVTGDTNNFYNCTIVDYSTDPATLTPVIGGPTPSAYYNSTNANGTGSVSVYTKVCYTIRRISNTQAEVFTEWFTSKFNLDNLYNAQGSFITPAFLTGGLNFNPGQYNEFKFFPALFDTSPSSAIRTRALSFYIEKLI